MGSGGANFLHRAITLVVPLLAKHTLLPTVVKGPGESEFSEYRSR